MLRKPVEAALFDMDGLLLDTEVLYIEAMQQAARSLGREMALDFCHSMVGVPARECSLMIEAYYGEGFSIEEFRGRFYELLRGLLDAGIPLKPGVVELLDFLAGRGLPLAVATSSERRTAERHLSHAGLLDRFTALVTRDDVEHPKPHPDIYLEAARRLGVAARTLHRLRGFQHRPAGSTRLRRHGLHGARPAAAPARNAGPVRRRPARPARRAKAAAPTSLEVDIEIVPH